MGRWSEKTESPEGATGRGGGCCPRGRGSLGKRSGEEGPRRGGPRGGGAIWWPCPSGKKGPGSAGSLDAWGGEPAGGWMPKGVLASGPSQPPGADAPRRLGISSPQHPCGTRDEARALWPAAPPNCHSLVSLRGVRPSSHYILEQNFPPHPPHPHRREEGSPRAPSHPTPERPRGQNPRAGSRGWERGLPQGGPRAGIDPTQLGQRLGRWTEGRP